jgi:hypothetical protein
MNAQSKLRSLYRQWRNWTEAETQAIQTRDWLKAGECQEAKSALQSPIQRWTEAAQNQVQRGSAEWAAFEKQMREWIAELITLESQNSERLAGQRIAADSERAELEQSARNLRRVRQSYSSPPASSAWQSYS